MFRVSHSFLKIPLRYVCPKFLKMKFAFLYQKIYYLETHCTFFFCQTFRFSGGLWIEDGKHLFTGFCQSAFLFHNYSYFSERHPFSLYYMQPLSILAVWSASILLFGFFFLKAFLGRGACFGRCAKTIIPHSPLISPLECCFSPTHFGLCKHYIM